MSASSSNTKYGNRYSVANTNKGGGKFCKICKDTGKTLSEYTSHYVRESPDPNSKVVCPTLIAAVCRYCKNGGHTVKHCPKIEARNRQEHKKDVHIISKNYCKETTDTKESLTYQSAFSVLQDDDENEGENEEIESTTHVTPPSPDIKKEHIISYASILKKPPPPPQSKKEENLTVSQVDSLIPTKLDFSQEVDTENADSIFDVTGKWSDDEDIEDCDILEINSDSLIPTKLGFSQEVHTENVITLFDVTGKWSDDEDIEDCDILELFRPTLNNKDHPLYHYNRWLHANLVTKFTEGYTKNMRVTEDALGELFERWDKDYFDNNNGLKVTMNMNPATNKNSRRMSVIMNFTK